MPIPDSQIGLLQTAANALHNWQETAAGVNVVLQQVVMEFPPNGVTHLVQFTWTPAVVVDGVEIEPGRFEISTLA